MRSATSRPGALIAVAALAAFTANIDLSIVNLALPTIGRAFDAGQSELAWVVSAYVLPFAVSILAVGSSVTPSAIGACWWSEASSSHWDR